MSADSLKLDPITLEIVWTRLIAIADEAATILKRTSFSPTVRESNDYSCVLFDENGDTVAENTIGIPSFNGVMSRALQTILTFVPIEKWQPGDIVITNDPWIASGHLLDITCVMPIFHRSKLVGFSGSIAHMADIGGSVWSADSREVFEEGIRIPPLHLYREGRLNESLAALIRCNVRVPDEVMGDIHAQIAAGRTASALMTELLEEYRIDKLSTVSRIVQHKAEASMKKAIAAIPDGEYSHSMRTDGIDGKPIDIRVKVTVEGERMTIDYTGSSDQVSHAINVPFNYTYAYTCFPVKCAIDRFTPRNEGSYRPIQVIAEPGSVLNPLFPAPVNGRHLVGHFLACAVYGALAKAIPGQTIADSGSAPQQYTIFTGKWKGRTFSSVLTICGGMGARPADDGLSCTSFPSNVSVGSMEIIEAVSPLIVWRKQLQTDSGGAGQFRGGLGQVVELEIRGDGPVQMSLMFDRIRHPAAGTNGAGAGSNAKVEINGAAPPTAKGRSMVQPGDRVKLQYPGGGGFGLAEERDPERVRADLSGGYISEEAALHVYKLNR